MFRAQLHVNINELDSDTLVNILNDLQECIAAGSPRDEDTLSRHKSDAEQALDSLLESGGITMNPAKAEARKYAVREMMRLGFGTPYWLTEDQERFEKMLGELTISASSATALHKHVDFGESSTHSNDHHPTHEADGQNDGRITHGNRPARDLNAEDVRDEMVWGHKRQLPGGFTGRVGARVSEGGAAAAKKIVQQLEQMDLSHVVSKIDTGNHRRRSHKRGKKEKKSQRRHRAKAKSVTSFAPGAAKLPPIMRSASVPPRLYARNGDARGTRSNAAGKKDPQTKEAKQKLRARKQTKRQQQREQRSVQRASAKRQQHRELHRVAVERNTRHRNSPGKGPGTVPILPPVRDHVIRMPQNAVATTICLTV
jgi:hypothetical protein